MIRDKNKTLDFLMVEDNPGDVMLLREYLHLSNIPIHEFYEAGSMNEVPAVVKNKKIDLAFLDLSLPDSTGVNSFVSLNEQLPQTPIIVLTGLSDINVALETLSLGAQDFLMKNDFNEKLLSKAIQYSIERKRMHEQLRESEKKYRQMFYRNPFPAWIYNFKTLQFLEVNDAALDKYGYSREEFLTLTLKDIRPAEDIPLLMKSLGDTRGHGMWRHNKKNGELMIVEVSFYPIDYFGKAAIQAQINDITEKLKMEKELAGRQKLITETTILAQEKERETIGKELHDNINQILAASKLYLDYSIKKQEPHTETLNKSRNYILLAIDEIRKLSHALIAPSLGDITLVEAMEEILVPLRFATPLKVKLITDKFNENTLDQNISLMLYRVIQEQLNNILKHSKAKNAQIELSTTSDSVLLRIIDDGIGFDTSKTPGGIGLRNISTRTEFYNGSVKIISSPGNGCILEVTIPYGTISQLPDEH